MYGVTPSLEASHRDGSNEGSQHMFSLRNKKTGLWIILSTPSYLELWVQSQFITTEHGLWSESTLFALFL